MPMTMSQKILADHAGLESVKPGQLIEVELDAVLGNDITTPVAIKEFEKPALILYSIKKKSISSLTTLFRTKTLRPPNNRLLVASSPTPTTSKTSLT